MMNLPQIIVLFWLVAAAIIPPIARLFLLARGSRTTKTWPQFWGGYTWDRIVHVALFLVLMWGGFWS